MKKVGIHTLFMSKSQYRMGKPTFIGTPGIYPMPVYKKSRDLPA